MTEPTSPRADGAAPVAGGDSATGPRIGFLAQIEHTGISTEELPERSGSSTVIRSQGISEGLDVFAAAADLGYDVGYVRTRHLQHTLSSPLLFLAAVGQHVPGIDLGTAVIPLWFEHPARLAEDLGTADLMLGGRLRPGLSSGYSAKDTQYMSAYGGTDTGHRDRVNRILRQLLEYLDGEIVATADSHIEDVEPGSPLRVQPQVPGLRDRLAYGAASVERAHWVGEQGLRLQLATLHPDDGTGRGIADMQAEVIAAYRDAAREAGTGDGYVSVTRQMMPVRDDAELERYTTLVPHERSARAGVDVEHTGTEIGGGSAVFSRVVIDEADVVAEALREDAAVQQADELVLALPYAGGTTEQRSILANFAENVVPLLR